VRVRLRVRRRRPVGTNELDVVPNDPTMLQEAVRWITAKHVEPRWLRACGDPVQRCALGNAAREFCSPFVRLRVVFSAGLARRLGWHHRQAVVWRAEGLCSGDVQRLSPAPHVPEDGQQEAQHRRQQRPACRSGPPRGAYLRPLCVHLSTPGRPARAQPTPNTPQSLCRLPIVF
jgi:hypothetical protein